MAPEAFSAGVLSDGTASAASQLSSGAFFGQAMVGSLAANAGSATSSISAGDVPAASSATSGVATKQDRSKGQAEPKKAAGGVEVAVVSVLADPARLPAVNIVTLQGAVHGQEHGSSENSAKNATGETSTGTHGKTAAPTGGRGDGDAGSTSLQVGTAAPTQGAPIETTTQPFEAGIDLSATAGVPVNPEVTSHTDAAASTSNSVGASAATTDSTSYRAADGPGSTKSGSTGAQASWHAAADSATTQGVPVDASKTGAGSVPPSGTANGAAPTTLPTVLTTMGSHEGVAAQSATAAGPGSGTSSTHAAKAQNLPASTQLPTGEGTAASGINSAKLIQTMGETEMHVGMHSAEFGDISIRTSLSQQQMVAQISLEHSDLSQTISSHLSTMQAKLGEEYGLHASIEINSQGAPLSGGQGDSQQRERQPTGRSISGMSIGPAELGESVSSVVALSSAGSGHGLDITV